MIMSTPLTGANIIAIPELIEGALTIDERGEVGYVNAFSFADVKRFYWVTNHRAGFVRAWHAHRREAKYFLAAQGTVLVGAVEIDNWERPSKQQKVWRFVLSARRPSILSVPPGYANGFMSLTEDSKLLVFSSAMLEDSQADDVRYPPRYWDIWTATER